MLLASRTMCIAWRMCGESEPAFAYEGGLTRSSASRAALASRPPLRRSRSSRMTVTVQSSGRWKFAQVITACFTEAPQRIQVVPFDDVSQFTQRSVGFEICVEDQHDDSFRGLHDGWRRNHPHAANQSIEGPRDLKSPLYPLPAHRHKPRRFFDERSVQLLATALVLDNSLGTCLSILG